MSTPYRAGNGKFVRRDNPIAVIGALQALRNEENARAEMQARHSNARRLGYCGPLTRAELAAMVRP